MKNFLKILCCGLAIFVLLIWFGVKNIQKNNIKTINESISYLEKLVQQGSLKLKTISLINFEIKYTKEEIEKKEYEKILTERKDRILTDITLYNQSKKDDISEKLDRLTDKKINIAYNKYINLNYEKELPTEAVGYILESFIIGLQDSEEKANELANQTENSAKIKDIINDFNQEQAISEIESKLIEDTVTYMESIDVSKLKSSTAKYLNNEIRHQKEYLDNKEYKSLIARNRGELKSEMGRLRDKETQENSKKIIDSLSNEKVIDCYHKYIELKFEKELDYEVYPEILKEYLIKIQNEKID